MSEQPDVREHGHTASRGARHTRGRERPYPPASERLAPIPFARPCLGEGERAAVADVLLGDQLAQGPAVRRFEADFARFTRAPHAVAVSSCMAALHLAYLALGLEPGDDVLVPAQTHAATAMAVELCGGRCTFVDSEPATGNMDLDRIEAHITPRTRGITVVHFLGMPVDMERILAIARAHGLFVVEDCALAPGATVAGTHVGLHGDAGAFSFYPAKHITTGEGGMLVTRVPAIAEAAAQQRAFGVHRPAARDAGSADYDVVRLGTNYRMSEMAGALGVAQLQRLPELLATRRANYETLTRQLRPIGHVSLLRSSHAHLTSACYCHYVVLEGPAAERRDDIAAYLHRHGIGTSVYYPRPLPAMTYFRRKYGHRPESFPVAHRLSQRSLALPVGPHVSPEGIDHIARTLADALSDLSP